MALRKELRLAEKLFKEEKLKNMANEMTIDVAERKYNNCIPKIPMPSNHGLSQSERTRSLKLRNVCFPLRLSWHQQARLQQA